MIISTRYLSLVQQLPMVTKCGGQEKLVNMILMQLAHPQSMGTTLPMVPEILKNNKLSVLSLLMMFGKMVKAVNMILMQLAHPQRTATTLPMVPAILKNVKLLVP